MGRGKKILDTGVVVEKAIELIEANGYEDFSTRKLAAQLRISAMTLYNYYENREAILKASIVRAFGILWLGLPEKIENCLGGGENPLRVYSVMVEHLLTFGLGRPKLYLFLFNADLSSLRWEVGVVDEYRKIFTGVEDRIIEKAMGESIYRDIYLFEVLANALIINVLKGRAGLTPEKFHELMSDAYSRLLQPDEKYFR